MLKNLLAQLGKQIVLGKLSVSLGTVCAATFLTLAVGATAIGVTAYQARNAEVPAMGQGVESEHTHEEESHVHEDGEDPHIHDGEDSHIHENEESHELTEEQAENAHYHTFSTVILTESTCTTAGSAEKTCSECGYKETYPLALKEHVGTNWIVEKAATETADGLQSLYCDACGTLMASEVIPIVPHNHNYIVESVSEGNCSEAGHKRFVCAICGSHYEETTPASGHKYDIQLVKEATCKEEGRIYKKCSICGDVIETGTIKKLAHVFSDWKAEVEATCTEEGKETRTCDVCKITETRTLPAIGHTILSGSREVVEEATCEDAGKATYICSDCNEVINETISALGHDYGEPEIVDSTCSAEGVRKYTCKRDSNHFYTEVISKKDHTESDWIIDLAPTCTEEGSRHTECTECGAVITTKAIHATGHTWSDFTEVTAPTCDEQGEEERTCSVCAEVETRSIPALGHNYVEVVDLEATCTEEGSKHQECSVCGDKLSNEAIPALGHSFTHYDVITPATDLAEGLERATCDHGCGETHERAIPKLPHTHDYAVETSRVDATCTEDGYYILTCACGSTMKIDLPALGHTYEAISHADADCVLDGEDVYECSVCGDTYTVVIPAHGHTSSDWTVIKEATDLEDGQKVRTCVDCGTTLETQVISKLPHTCDFDKFLEKQDATCTTDGYELYECRCGLTEKVILPKLNHSNSEWQTVKEATYTEMGLKEHVCLDCGYILESEDVPVLPHEHTYEVTDSTDATCTEAGSTTETCNICGHTKTTTIPATGHMESGWIVDVSPTCQNEGEQHTKCNVCGITLKTETLDKTAHIESGWILDKSANCTEDGSQHTQCTVCGTTISTETISATGHSMGDWHVTSSASCEGSGTEERNCGNCSYTESRNLPALGHDYGDWIIDEEATEESGGLKHKECSRCDSVITEDIEQLPPHVHSYSETGRTDSTCTSVGSITYTCSDCGASYSEEISKKAHTHGDWVVKTPATEAAEGLETRSCTVCGVELDSKVIPKLEHVHNYVTDRKEATCTEDGYEKKTCSSCGSVINTVLPATGHQYSEAVVVAPTCTEKGSSTITCSVDGHKVVTELDATGHHYVETSRVAPTCETAGSITYTCDNCGDSYTEPLEKLEHEYLETSVIEDTCTEDGYTIETCKNCGDTRHTNVVEATEHISGDWEIVKEAELGVKGLKEMRCTVCDALIDSEEIPMLMTDGTDSVYFFKVEDAEGKLYDEMVIGHYNEAEAQEMFDLVNAHRVSIGKTPFDICPYQAFIDYTNLRARETSFLWDHTRPNGGGPQYGENIAIGIRKFDMDTGWRNSTVEEVFNAWMNSSGHRDNIEFDHYYNQSAVSVFYKKVEVGQIGDTIQYGYLAYWVQTFRN